MGAFPIGLPSSQGINNDGKKSASALLIPVAIAPAALA